MNPPINKLSSAETVIAHLLDESRTPLFGLELVRRSPPGDLQLKKGTIYVTLERMEKKGLVTSMMETTPPAHIEPGTFYIPRRMYTLTETGKQALAVTRTALDRFHHYLLGPQNG